MPTLTDMTNLQLGLVASPVCKDPAILLPVLA